MAYKFSQNVLELEHTVPPTIPIYYRSKNLYGTLQLFVKPDLNLAKHLTECINGANSESYDNLQIFLFCTAMSDVNTEAIIPWYKNGKVNFTYVDCEFAFSTEQCYGKSSPELDNTLLNHSNPQHVFTSKFTLSFPSTTLEKLKAVNIQTLEDLWKSTLTEVRSIGIIPDIPLEDKDIYLKFIMRDINSILKAAEA